MAVLVLVRLAEGSKAIGDMLGPPGRWLRRRFEHNEMLRREERKREFREVLLDQDSPDYKALQRRTDTLCKMIKQLEAEIKQLKKIEQANAVNWDMTAEYLREDAQWHIDAGISLAEKNIKLPKHRSYSQFCREYRATHDIKYGRRWSDAEEEEDG